MSQEDKKSIITKSSLARMAGNIAAGFLMDNRLTREQAERIATDSVMLAKLIVAELEKPEGQEGA